MVQSSFDNLSSEFHDDIFFFMGDSAGGSLAFAKKLFYDNAPIQPLKLILFSPWLDLTMQNPAIQQQECLDFILPLNALLQAGLKYAGGDDLSQYLLSPMN